jgi:hypothetical protein
MLIGSLLNPQPGLCNMVEIRPLGSTAKLAKVATFSELERMKGGSLYLTE